jgi:hypothetical protein
MKITGKHAFRADQEAVWAVLMDPEAIASAIPGADKLIPIEGEQNAWRVAVKIGIASVSGTYSGTIRMTDIQAPDSYRLTVSGEGKQSIINGSALISLRYDPEKSRTHLDWDADANLSGKLASIGQRLVGAAARMLAKLFFRSLAKRLPDGADIADEDLEEGDTQPTPNSAITD